MTLRRLIEKLRRLILVEGGLPIVWIALSALVLVPIWHQRLLPMLDTPAHLALVRGWHNFHDPSYKIAEYYTLRLRPVPYILFYLVVHLLMFVFSIEVANKIFLSIYVLLYPLSILMAARALRRSPWLALGGFALAFNQTWIYGFSSYLMGTCFLFFSFAFLILYLRDGKKHHLALLFLSSLLAYFGHVLAWFCFGLAAITIFIVQRRKWRRGLAASAVLLPSVALAIYSYLDDRREHTYLKAAGHFQASWRDFPTSVMEFPRRVMELFPGRLDTLVFTVLALTVLGLCIWKGTRLSREGEPEDRILKWVLIVFGLTYLTLPYNINKPMSWWYVSPRLPSMMAPLLLLLPTVKISGWRRALMLPLIAGCVALPIKLARLYRDFSVRNAGFMRLVGETPRGAKVMVVVRGMMRGQGSEEKSGDPATSAPVYWHWNSWPMALHGGYDAYIFDQGVPIRPKVKLKVPSWSAPDSFDIREAPDFDYYLVRLPSASMNREPSLRILDQIGEWTLYKRIGNLTDEP